MWRTFNTNILKKDQRTFLLDADPQKVVKAKTSQQDIMKFFFSIQHAGHGWIFGHRWEALDVRALKGKRLLQLQVIQPLDKSDPTSRQEVIESPDHARPPPLGLSREVAMLLQRTGMPSNYPPGLRCTQSVPFRRQRWRSVKRQRGDIAHWRGHPRNASKLPDVQIPNKLCWAQRLWLLFTTTQGVKTWNVLQSNQCILTWAPHLWLEWIWLGKDGWDQDTNI